MFRPSRERAIGDMPRSSRARCSWFSASISRRAALRGSPLSSSPCRSSQTRRLRQRLSATAASPLRRGPRGLVERVRAELQARQDALAAEPSIVDLADPSQQHLTEEEATNATA